MTFHSYIRRPLTAQPASMSPRQVAKAYNFPTDLASGKGYTGGIIELGGGYKQSQVAAYFTSNGLPVPTFISVPVDGGKNKQDGPNGADGEVQLDMIVAGAIATSATFRVYFCPNTNDGFLAGIKQAVADGCDGISISWGGAESGWDSATMDEFETVIKAARAAGIPVFVAAGDNGSKDSTGANSVDFPASAPDSVGCGGTRLEINSDGTRASETVWDDSSITSATGGGVSVQFPGRQVPDQAGNADPDSGYAIDIDGDTGVVIGGTSAVAPLSLGLHALLWELNGGKPFDYLNLTVTNPTAFFDVTQGNNGGFRAGPGRDDDTGVGVPDGGLLAKAITGGVTPPAPPAPTPPAPLTTETLTGTFVGTFTPETKA